MERDNDIEFDFFDEPETTEAPPPPRRIPRRGGPRRPVRPAAGFTPLLRLVGLIAFAILIVVLLVFWIQGCRDDARKNSYKNYMEKATTVANASAGDGKEFTALLTTTGVKEAEAEAKLRAIAERERQNVANAADLGPPGPLRPEHRHLVEALQLRVSGLVGMADALRRTAGSKKIDEASAQLAKGAQRLVASDVVWDDLFKDPAVAELDKQGIHEVVPPDSNFVKTQDLDSVATLKPFIQRLRGASTGGTPTGIHGTNIESVSTADGKQLVAGESNVIVASPSLGFNVLVKNSGDSQEVGIKVTLTIAKPGSPIVLTKTIDLINAGETKTVAFKKVDVGGLFAQKTQLRVDVSTVKGEKNKSNNSAVYDVIFSLPPA